MAEVVIKVENLGKQYRLGQVGTGTLARDLNSWWYKARGKEDPNLKIGVVNDRTAKAGGDDLVWALKDINFEVKQGEVLGIIGKNGAGKSTLLKILSKVTSPTVGSVKIKGRIASLLEVGTGFHPDLSGRENIFLNGAILGMTKKEINSKFDEIVAFAGVERYIDTPVKRYSSGMYVRLAFAVAAHLEPEILIIDEVLAVGDVEFQKKCLGKMKDVSVQGRTVIFVSHNMASVKALCTKGFLIEKGSIAYEGLINDTIGKYFAKTIQVSSSGIIFEGASSENTGVVRFTKIIMSNKNGNIVDSINYLSPILLQLELESKEFISDTIIDVRINTLDGIQLIHTMNKYSSRDSAPIQKGLNSIECEMENNLQPGKYYIAIGVHQMNGLSLDYVENILDFTVLDVTEGESMGFVYPWKLGYVRFESTWKINN